VRNLRDVGLRLLGGAIVQQDTCLTQSIGQFVETSVYPESRLQIVKASTGDGMMEAPLVDWTERMSSGFGCISWRLSAEIVLWPKQVSHAMETITSAIVTNGGPISGLYRETSVESNASIVHLGQIWMLDSVR
jgi:hypothetical protein